MGDDAFTTLRWDGEALVVLDQTLLPAEERYVRLADVPSVAEAIRSLRVRGAPAIGCAAAYGLCVAALASDAATPGAVLTDVEEAARILGATRPTAVNLFWALERMLAAARRGYASVDEALRALIAEADAITAEDYESCRAIGRHGATLVPEGAGILTHCNAGGLATAGYGTALGVIRAAHEAGKRVHAYADETRPLLQGARLTAWELKALGIPVTLSCDGAAAGHVASGRVQLAVVGADRIARNGDVANKVGTLGVAIVCHHYGIPLYVAAPRSTIDPGIASGREIPIEERCVSEVAAFRGVQCAPSPDGSLSVANPAFDVTPAGLVSAIVTEVGVVRPPYEEGLARALAQEG